MRCGLLLIGSISTTAACGRCSGTGEDSEHYCGVCRGSGTIIQSKDVSIRVPAGVESGEDIITMCWLDLLSSLHALTALIHMQAIQ